MGKPFFLFLFILPFQLYAQLPLGARYSAMAHASAALTGLDALAGNSAGITSLSGTAASLSLENEWLSAPIRTNAFVVVPSAVAHVGLAGSVYETGDAFRELQLAAALGRRVSDRSSIGVRLSYRQLSFSDLEGSMSRLTADLGFQYRFLPHWMWGLELISPLALGRSKEEVVPLFKLGTRFTFSPQTLIALQAAYSSRDGADFSIGLEYEILSWLLLRGGISVDPFMHYGGLGLLMKRFKADGALRIHPQLGVSPQMTLGYAF